MKKKGEVPAAVSGRAAVRKMPRGKPFEKGQSGNPGGRAKNFTTLISQAFSEALGEMDLETKQTNAAYIAARLMELLKQELKKGNLSKEVVGLVRELSDRTEGRPAQKVTIDGIETEDPMERLRKLLDLGRSRRLGVSE